MVAVRQSATATASATSVTATWPSGAPVNGNTLVAIVNSDSTITTPSGWTVRRSLVNTQGFGIYEKIAGAAETTTVTVSPTATAATALTVIELNASDVGVFDIVGTDTE